MNLNLEQRKEIRKFAKIRRNFDKARILFKTRFYHQVLLNFL